jgi:SAM-dependent methyltransferase
MMMGRKHYRQRFYTSRHEKTLYSAETILSIALRIIPEVRSAVDVGCGVGTWLYALKNKGVQEVLGIDGNWVDRALLMIPQDCFMASDVSQGISLPKRYDLVLSLEVAEHIPQDRVSTYVRSLSGLSDYILFSAAVPHQGGRHHVNEQWPRYWADLFHDQGYACIDIIRWVIWDDPEIPPYYRQNVMLYVKEEKEDGLRLSNGGIDIRSPRAVVHPDIFVPKMRKAMTVRGAWKLLWRSIRRNVFIYR